MDLGLTNYNEAYILQRELVEKRKIREVEDTLLLTEHRNVITIGRTGSLANLLADEDFLRMRAIEVLNVDRGGDITFHGPGQIVAYPIIDLRKRGKDLHRYLWELEEVVIDFLGAYSVEGFRIAGKRGVWTDDGKISSIGVAASGWITYHGLSVNVSLDLKYFSLIRFCGLQDAKAASLEEILGRPVSIAEAKKVFSDSFKKIFSDKASDVSAIFSLVG